MTEIGIGIIGGGYMGKAHAVAMSAVGAVFNTKLRPSLEMIAASSPQSAENYRSAYGFKRAAQDWQQLVADPKVHAVIIATPPHTHLDIARAAFANGKHVFCEKPLGSSYEQGQELCALAQAARPLVNMVGFNYIRTPAAQYACELLQNQELGRITYVRAEHCEDYMSAPDAPASWRTLGKNNGAMGDLSHVFNLALRLNGAIHSLSAQLETVHKQRKRADGVYESVENDDHGQLLCRYENGAMGHLLFSRIATGRKMGYAFEIFGTKGALRFDQENQNSL